MTTIRSFFERYLKELKSGFLLLILIFFIALLGKYVVNAPSGIIDQIIWGNGITLAAYFIFFVIGKATTITHIEVEYNNRQTRGEELTLFKSAEGDSAILFIDVKTIPTRFYRWVAEKIRDNNGKLVCTIDIHSSLVKYIIEDNPGQLDINCTDNTIEINLTPLLANNAVELIVYIRAIANLSAPAVRSSVECNTRCEVDKLSISFLAHLIRLHYKGIQNITVKREHL